MIENEELIKRWRLIIGDNTVINPKLSLDEIKIDTLLNQIYSNKLTKNVKKASLEESYPHISNWIKDINKYFQKPIIKVIQKDALEILDLKQIVSNPELLELMEADVNLISDIIALSNVMNYETKESAKIIVKKVVDDLERKLSKKFIKSVKESLNKIGVRNNPTYKNINWNKTIIRNLKHYQKEYKTIIPVNKVGFSHKNQKVIKKIILCVDQSGSMSTSLVYSAIYSSILSSIKSIKTHFIAFDTSVVDFSDKIQDPIDLLFGFQLGGGTDINQALLYCKKFIEKPLETIFILLTDLYDGGNIENTIKTIEEIKLSGVNFISLLSLTDYSEISYDKEVAKKIAQIGVKAFACTPNQFPNIMADAINEENIYST